MRSVILAEFKCFCLSVNYLRTLPKTYKFREIEVDFAFLYNCEVYGYEQKFSWLVLEFLYLFDLPLFSIFYFIFN